MNLEISIAYNSWNEEEVRSIAAECAKAVFSEIKLNKNNVEICLLFANDKEIRILNKTYRGVDKPTNVLSFPMESPPNDNDDYYILGSIALAFETIKRESLEQKKSFQDHLKHLIVHSLLHLLRYDHANKNEAEQMEMLEVVILKKMNVKNPYGESCYDIED
ncbi:MAG: rRNA maturation RNase YbeY [Holosporaceae bacterium]|jgi:probable rRNA maturation factor|nr:rRNA maturation RNase YbeY [Holosporaceae bacterium]